MEKGNFLAMEWLSHFLPGTGPDGKPILSVIVKRTYRFDHNKTAWEDREEQIPILEADLFMGEGDPIKDALLLEADLVAYKPLTDVVFIGKAHVPAGAGGQGPGGQGPGGQGPGGQGPGTIKLPQLDFGLEVAGFRKVGRAIGNRKVIVSGSGITFSAPEPFSEMPINLMQAYGGSDRDSDPAGPSSYPRNPAGKGFIVKDTPAALQGLALPNIEDPKKPLTPQNLILGKYERWKEYPEPFTLGCLNKNFYPRYTLAGLDAPGASGVKPEFFNCATVGLKLPYLVGDEQIRLANLDPILGRFVFNLPGQRPEAWLDTGHGPNVLDTVLQTVVIYKSTNQVTLVWRGSLAYGGIAELETYPTLEFGARDRIQTQ